MVQDVIAALEAPFTTDRVLEVRRGKMRPMAGLKVESAIDKQLVSDSIYIDKMGLKDDEHDYTFHGGVDKAVHGCESKPWPLSLRMPGV